MTQAEVVGVHSKLIPEVWPHVKHYIEQGLNSSRFDNFDMQMVYERLCDAKYQCWLCIIDRKIMAACCTMTGENHKLYILGLGGVQMTLWVDILWQELKAFAQRTGCTTIGGYGRRGWLRVLKLHNVRTQFSWEVDTEQ